MPGQPPRADASPAEKSPRGCENGSPPQNADQQDTDEVMEDTKIAVRERDSADPENEGSTETADLPPQESPLEDTLMEPSPVPPNPKRATKKRAKTPTTTPKRTSKKAKKKAKKKPPAEDPDSSDREIVDPLRASLTWQEDEITVYDPEDADDDGEGMDGVGFQPPPGAARATARRKLGQLAGYRRMVEQEARERRRRRRGGREKDGEGERVTRVRFLEGETIIEVV